MEEYNKEEIAMLALSASMLVGLFTNIGPIIVLALEEIVKSLFLIFG